MIQQISRSKTWLLAAMAFLIFASGAAAQQVEITPFVAWRGGGDFLSDFDDFGFDIDIEADDSDAAGLSLGFSINPNMQIELFWSHQDTALLEDGGIFLDDIELFDLDIDYYHVGFLYQWSPGQFRPFVTASAGVTDFGPQEPGLSSDSFFSASVGGGLKLMFGNHVGLRLEGRAFSTFVDEGGDALCERGRRCSSYDDDYFVQAEARAGLILAF